MNLTIVCEICKFKLNAAEWVLDSIERKFQTTKKICWLQQVQWYYIEKYNAKEQWLWL